MGQAYTPGLKVTNRIRHRVKRLLPIQGEVLVKKGDHVNARDIVARSFMPGDITPLNMSNLLSLPPADVPECMLKQEDEPIKVGEPLARTKGIFGFFKNEYKSKVEGTIEHISPVTGQVIIRGQPIPVQVEAYLAGTVINIIPNEGVEIEADVSFIQGIFGIGGEAHGPITLACNTHQEDLTADVITSDMKDCVVIGGARITAKGIHKAIDVGVSAVVSGGIDDSDLKQILGYDLGVAITGQEQIGLTIITTEGFGDIAMAERTFNLLKLRKGDIAAVNGATQIRAGVMRPEVVIPLTDEEIAHEKESDFAGGVLEIGRLVRIIRDPHFGSIGSVCMLPHELTSLESGSKARVLEVQLDSGETVTIPRANVEMIEL